MRKSDVLELANEINTRVKEIERDIGEESFNPLISKLLMEEIRFEEIEEDLSDVTLDRTLQLIRQGNSLSKVLKLLKDASVPKFVCLNVVPNEIASLSVGPVEVCLPSDIVKKAKTLSAEDFRLLQQAIRAAYPSSESESVYADCRLDRWALVVNEDRFLESTHLLLNDCDFEIG
jgi:hypothetical protein